MWCHKVLTDNISIKGLRGTVKQCLIKLPLLVYVCESVCLREREREDCPQVDKGALKTAAPFNQR